MEQDKMKLLVEELEGIGLYVAHADTIMGSLKSVRSDLEEAPKISPEFDKVVDMAIGRMDSAIEKFDKLTKTLIKFSII